MERSARARSNPTRSPWRHAGRRFGNVLVSMESDEELSLFFDSAEVQMSNPSTQCLCDATVLSALYTERPWPWVLTRRLQHLVGVVESMPGVRAEYFGAYHTGRTKATSPIAWLTELAVSDVEQLSAWRKQALRECERAVAAYQRTRGDGPSVAPKEPR